MSEAKGVLPRHVAIIMDGNGRWAKQHSLAVALGHRQGVEALREIIRFSSDIGIQVLSLYAFSTENWKRSKAEIAALMNLICEFFKSEIDELDAKQVRIRILGEKDALPAPQREAVTGAELRTDHNKGLQLNIALNYGGQAEILRAARALAQQVQQGKLAAEEIDEGRFRAQLYTYDQPDVDLLIRTSGEMRLSNFLLFQNAYAEMVFPATLWPDFGVEDFRGLIESFGHRDRRFGGRHP
ncbi:MAG: isoprenyl transferase [Christensenellales bacterium]